MAGAMAVPPGPDTDSEFSKSFWHSKVQELPGTSLCPAHQQHCSMSAQAEGGKATPLLEREMQWQRKEGHC